VWLANFPKLPATEGKNIEDSDTENDILTGSGLSADSNFAVVSSGELKQLQEKNSNKNMMTVTWLNRFARWRTVRNIPYYLEDIPEQEKDRKFSTSRRVSNGKAIELRERGYGKKKHKSAHDALTSEEGEQLWQKHILGSKNPLSLNHTIFFQLSQHFGTRGSQEHHQLRVEDLKFVCDISGKLLSVE